MDSDISLRNDIKILIVEDSRTQAEQLQFILEKRNFKVSAASDGKKALAFLRHHKPDIVVADIVMPEMDGYELCKHIRADQSLQEIPVILVTSLSDPTDVIKGLEVGATNFITKPYDEKYLISRIEHLIANRHLRKDSKAGQDVNIYYAGENHRITADRMQVLDLLLSTYENAYCQNRELLAAQKELIELNERLEELVGERDIEIAERRRMEAALQRAHEELELRIQERTEELRNAYEELIEQTKERELAEAQLRQAQKMEAIGTLAGGIAHDFNNILAGIIGFAEMALDDISPEDPVHHKLELVLKGGIRGRDLVKQILSFSRQTGRETKPVSISQIIEETFKLLRPAFPATIEIKKRLHHVHDIVLADPVQMHQVFMNLCTNAAYAMRDAGGVLEVTLADCDVPEEPAASRGDSKQAAYIRLSVSDTGCGMARDVVEKIFDPFFTTKGPGEGTGMGLSVVHGIVKGHGGHIIVHSEPGKGSTFHVYLPKAKSDSAVSGDARPLIKGGRECILYVDDEEMLVELNSQRLESLGYTVVGCVSSAEALKIFKAEPGRFDLVISDYTMPHMTGSELARRLIKVRPDIPIILSSGLNEGIKSEMIDHASITAFVAKTVGKRELADVVRSVLDGRQKQPQ